MGIGLQPQREAKIWWVFYFIGFIIVGHMFILNLFVGVVIDNFNHMKEQLGGYILLSEQQRNWVEQQRQMIRRKLVRKYEIPKQPCRKCSYNLVEKRYFEFIITFCIMLNTLVMAMRYYRMRRQYEQALEVANFLFAFIFNAEATIQIAAKGFYYFTSSWNVFDFVVVLGTDFGILIRIFSDQKALATAITIIRAFRIMRIVRLIKASKNLKVISQTLVYIIPSLANIGMLIFLLFFIYAAVGVNLFGTVKHRQFITTHANFESFGSALLLLLRCTTGEQWNDLMNEYSLTHECTHNQSYTSLVEHGAQGCGSPVSFVYFISFMLLISMMMMNLFVAVVIQGFAESTKENTGPVTAEDYDRLVKLWAEYDPKAKGWIKPRDLVFLLYELEQPLGYKNENVARDYDTIITRLRQRGMSLHNAKLELHNKYQYNKPSCLITNTDMIKVLNELALPVYDKDNVHFKDITIKLTQQCMEKQGLSSNRFNITVESVNKALDKEWKGRFPQLTVRRRKLGFPGEHSGSWLARRVIQQFLLNRKRKTRLHLESQKKKDAHPKLHLEEDQHTRGRKYPKPTTLEEISELPEEAGTMDVERRESSYQDGKKIKRKATRLFNPFVNVNKYFHSALKMPQGKRGTQKLGVSKESEDVSDWWKIEEDVKKESSKSLVSPTLIPSPILLESKKSRMDKMKGGRRSVYSDEAQLSVGTIKAKDGMFRKKTSESEDTVPRGKRLE